MVNKKKEPIRKEASDSIPLFAGCKYMVKKSDLKRIYSPKPALYTVRLTEILFNKKELQESYLGRMSHSGDDLKELDPDRVAAISSKLI